MSPLFSFSLLISCPCYLSPFFYLIFPSPHLRRSNPSLSKVNTLPPSIAASIVQSIMKRTFLECLVLLPLTSYAPLSICLLFMFVCPLLCLDLFLYPTVFGGVFRVHLHSHLFSPQCAGIDRSLLPSNSTRRSLHSTRSKSRMGRRT